MWHEVGPSRQNLVLSLLAVLMSLAVGVGVPLLQSTPRPRQEHAAWSRPSPTPSATSTALPGVAPVALDADTHDGALIAWQEPGPATPSSIPLASPAADPASSPFADAPGPTRTASVGPVDAASPAVAALSTLEPADTATPSPTATARPTNPSSVLPTFTANDLPALPTRQPSLQAPASGPSTSTASRRVPAVDVMAANPSASALLASGSTAAPAVASPTTSAASLAQPPVVMAPALLRPGLEARLRGVVQFNWQPTSVLPVGAYYELVVWSPEQGPSQAWGVAPPRTTTSLSLNLDELFRSGRFREGALYWTVLVVQQNPYRRLTLPAESERGYLVLATDG